MARRRSPSRNRGKSKTMWTGFNNPNTTVGLALTTLVLWDPALYPEISVGNLVLERIVGNLRIRALTGSPLVNWYFGVFDTDGTDTVPAAAIPDPQISDVDLVEKKNLFGFGQVALAATTATSSLLDISLGPKALQVDVSSKRRIGGNKAVLFVITSSVDASVNLSGVLRLIAKVPQGV